MRIGTVRMLMMLLVVGCGDPRPSGSDGANSAITSPQPGTDAQDTNARKATTLDELPQRTEGPLALMPVRVRLKKGVEFNLRIPEGYELKVAAEGMDRLRFIAPAPDGRLFITDMHDLTDNRKGRVYVLSGWNEDSARFSVRHTYLSGLRNPNQVAFHTTATDTFLYVATTAELLRYRYHAGDTVPSATGLVIDTFPSYGLSYKYGGWHLTRSLAFHGGKLYVSVGSSCNACIEQEEVRATVLEMDPDGANKRIYATGLRNAVGMRWIDDQLFATDMGSDQFGPDAPEDKLQRVTDGGYYGWPHFYQRGEEVITDTAFTDLDVPLVPPKKAYAALGAHTAPLGFDLFAGYGDERLRNSFVIALHGSSIVKMAKGYAIVRVRPGMPTETVVDGFLRNGERFGRPCDVRMRDPESFWFTDDLNGVLYLLRRSP